MDEIHTLATRHGIRVIEDAAHALPASYQGRSVGALSESIATNLTPQAGQQNISDMQTEFANAQTQIQAATARQTQTQTMMQNLIDTTENVSTDQVASELLAVQNSLQASYQATSMLAQLSLTKYLSPGG